MTTRKWGMFLALLGVILFGKAGVAEEKGVETDETILADIAFAKANFPDESERWPSTMNGEYRQTVLDYTQSQMAKIPQSAEPQFFIFVDRNFDRQNIMVGFWNGVGKVIEIGWSKVSTGSLKFGHYLTPVGTFPIVRLGYRAKGTKNAKGWMGLGGKDSRIWSFGEQETTGWKGKWMRITMLMHATDPTYGEPRLGRPDSKGCIRISAKMNAFLDIYGILDQQVMGKESPERQRRLLRKDRQPVANPGLYMIVGDFPPIK
ncbi:L,D-transpeptidase [Candidatus Uhrbacteria bacterium]|nr:L,D-transpeptidase [Candidatus Uhrbacteria bacterium]